MDQLRLSMAALEEENKRYKQLLQNAGITDASSLVGDQAKTEAKDNQPGSSQTSLFVSMASSCDGVDQLLDVSLDTSGLFSLSPLPMATSDASSTACLDSNALAGWTAAVSQAVGSVTSLLTINTSSAVTNSIDALASFDVASALVEDGLLSPDFMQELVGDTRPTEQEIRELDELAASVSQEERDAVNIDAVLQDIAAATENCDLLLNPDDVMLNMNLAGLGSDGCLNQALLPPASGSATCRESTAVTNSVSFASPIMTTGVVSDAAGMTTSGMPYTPLGMIGSMATQSGQSLGSLQGTLVLQANGQLLLLPSTPVPAMMPSTPMPAMMPATPMPPQMQLLPPTAQISSSALSGTVTAPVANSTSNVPRLIPTLSGGTHPNSYIQSAVAAANLQHQQMLLQQTPCSNRVITVNTLNGVITMNTMPSQPSQLPTALILPNGQIVPVVTQPSTMFNQKNASVSSRPQLSAPNSTYSAISNSQSTSLQQQQQQLVNSSAMINNSTCATSHNMPLAALMSQTNAMPNSAPLSSAAAGRPGMPGMPAAAMVPAGGATQLQQRVAGLPQTLQAIVTPEGNIIITLPPAAAVPNTPTTPQAPALPAVPPASSTPPAAKSLNKSKGGSAAAQPRKAGSSNGAAPNKASAGGGGGGNHRALMPKPAGGALAKLAPNALPTSGNSSTSNSAMPMTTLGLLNDINQASYSSSPLSMSMSAAHQLDATDILAQAAESILLASPTGLTSELASGFFNSLHDDSGLQMDASMEADDTDAPTKSKSKSKSKKKSTKKSNANNSFSGTSDSTSSNMYMADSLAYQNHGMLMSDALDSSGLLSDYMKDDFADINDFADLIKINVASLVPKADIPSTATMSADNGSAAMPIDRQQQDTCDAMCDADMEALARLWSMPEQPAVISCSQPPAAAKDSRIGTIASLSSAIGGSSATTVSSFAVTSISELFSKNVAIPPTSSECVPSVKSAEVSISQSTNASSAASGSFDDSLYTSVLSPTTGLLVRSAVSSDSNTCGDKGSGSKTECSITSDSDDDFCSPSQLYLSKGYSSRGSVSYANREKSQTVASSSSLSPSKALLAKPATDSAKTKVKKETKRVSRSEKRLDIEADLFQSSAFNDVTKSLGEFSDDELEESVKPSLNKIKSPLLNNEKEEAVLGVAPLQNTKVDDTPEEQAVDAASDHEDFIVEIVPSKKKGKAGKSRKAVAADESKDLLSPSDSNVSPLDRRISARRKSSNCKIDEIAAVEVASETVAAVGEPPAVSEASIEKKTKQSVETCSSKTTAEIKADVVPEIAPALTEAAGTNKSAKTRGRKKKNDLAFASDSALEIMASHDDSGISVEHSSLSEQQIADAEEVKPTASVDAAAMQYAAKTRAGRRRNDSTVAAECAVVDDLHLDEGLGISEANKNDASFENACSSIVADAEDVTAMSNEAIVNDKQAELEVEQIETVAKPKTASKGKGKRGRKGVSRSKRYNSRRSSNANIAVSTGQVKKSEEADELSAADVDDATEPLDDDDDDVLPTLDRKEVEELVSMKNNVENVANLCATENDDVREEIHALESSDEAAEPLTEDAEEVDEPKDDSQQEKQKDGYVDMSTKLKVCTVDLVDVMMGQAGALTSEKSRKSGKSKNKSKSSKSKKKRKLDNCDTEPLSISIEEDVVEEEAPKTVPPLRIVSPVKISIASHADIMFSDDDNYMGEEEETEVVQLPSPGKGSIADVQESRKSKSRKRKHTSLGNEKTGTAESSPIRSASASEEMTLNIDEQTIDEKGSVRKTKESKKSKNRKRKRTTVMEDQDIIASEVEQSTNFISADNLATTDVVEVERRTNTDDVWVQNNQQSIEEPKPPSVVLKVLKSAFAPKSSKKSKSKKVKSENGGGFDIFDFDSSENVAPLPALHRKPSVSEQEQLPIEPIRIKKKSPKKKKKKKRSKDRSPASPAADEYAHLDSIDASSPLPNDEDSQADAADDASKPQSSLSNCSGVAAESPYQQAIDDNDSSEVPAEEPVETRRVAPMRLPKNTYILPVSPANEEENEVLNESNDNTALDQPESPAYDESSSANVSRAASPLPAQGDDAHDVPSPAQHDAALDVSAQQPISVEINREVGVGHSGVLRSTSCNLERRTPGELVEQQNVSGRSADSRDHADRSSIAGISLNLLSKAERLQSSQQDHSSEAVIQSQYSLNDDCLMNIKRPRRLTQPDRPSSHDSVPTDYSLHRHSPRKLPSDADRHVDGIQHQSLMRQEEERPKTEDSRKSSSSNFAYTNKTSSNSNSSRSTSHQLYEDDQPANHHQVSSMSSKSSSKSSAKRSGLGETASSRYDSRSVYDQPPTYYPPIKQLSPPLPSDVASPFFAANLFAANKAAADIVNPFMFPPSHASLGLGFSMGPNSQLAAASHFGLSNIFSEMNGSAAKTESLSPIKFPSQPSAADHSRSHLSSAAMLQNAAAAMSLFGHAAHSAGFDRLDRPLPTTPLPAHLTGSKHSSFGMPLNFAMHDR